MFAAKAYPGYCDFFLASLTMFRKRANVIEYPLGFLGGK